jgi:hypothetical protein
MLNPGAARLPTAMQNPGAAIPLPRSATLNKKKINYLCFTKLFLSIQFMLTGPNLVPIGIKTLKEVTFMFFSYSSLGFGSSRHVRLVLCFPGFRCPNYQPARILHGHGAKHHFLQFFSVDCPPPPAGYGICLDICQ